MVQALLLMLLTLAARIDDCVTKPIRVDALVAPLRAALPAALPRAGGAQ